MKKILAIMVCIFIGNTYFCEAQQRVRRNQRNWINGNANLNNSFGLNRSAFLTNQRFINGIRINQPIYRLVHVPVFLGYTRRGFQKWGTRTYWIYVY
jgi:hypothetical protein